MNRETRRVVVLGGNRIPFARSNTAYADASNQEMLTAALDGLVTRFGLEGERLGEVVAGAVLKHSRDFNLTRECLLSSGLSAETPAYDLQQACGTSLETVMTVGSKIALGQIESGIVPAGTTLPPRNLGVRGWDEHEPDERRLFARLAGAYAASCGEKSISTSPRETLT